MSAICGIFNVDGSPADVELLSRMRDIVDYRGPDGRGIWTSGSIGLAHRLLVTTQESVGESQPMANGKGLWITADCRIDNREELKAEFMARGNRADFDAMPDVAYILMAYEAWGGDAPNHLLGDFAFAIWDAREGLLFCCRDPLGVKPFVYHRSERQFLFASEMKQILCSPISTTLNVNQLSDYLTMIFPRSDETPYEEICRLPPGHILKIRRGLFETRRYWTWEPDTEPPSRLSMAQNAEKLRALIEKAVRARLRAPNGFRTGSFLSGGLDSSTIVAVAVRTCEFRHTSFPVLTLRFPEANPLYAYRHRDPVDESRYSNSVIERYGLEAHTVNIQGWGPFENFLENTWFQETPLFSPNLAYFQHSLKTIRNLGIRNILHGEGGDELFITGSRCLVYPLKKGDLPGFIRELRGQHRIRGTPYATLLKRFLRITAPDPLKIAYRRARRTRIPSWIDKRFAKKIRLGDRLASDFNRQHQHHASGSYGILIWIKASCIPFYLETLDRMASSNRMEIRMPFLDLRVLRFMAAVPWHQKYREGVTKLLLREAFREELPPLIRGRLGKSEFTPVIRSGIENYATHIFKDSLLNPHPLVREIVRMEKIGRIYTSCLCKKGPAVSNSIWLLWYIAVVDQWLKTQPIVLAKIRGYRNEKENNTFLQKEPAASNR